MPRYLRPHVKGATVFFTVALADRGASTLIDAVDLLRDAVSETRRERPFEIVAWVVLPDHLHCIWRLPGGDADFSTRWGAIKARFTRALRDRGRVGFNPTLAQACGRSVGWNPTLRKSASKARKGDAGIWQRRFYEHHIRGPADLDMHIRYCWTNPVKHGFAARPMDWACSSIHRDVRLGRCDPEYAGEAVEGDFGETDMGVLMAG